MWVFQVQVSLVNHLLRHHPVGMEDHMDITDVLTAMHLLDCVQPLIPEGPNEEAATPAGPSTTEGPSTSLAPAGCPYCPLVATPRLSLPPIPLHPPHIHPLALLSLHPPHIHSLAPPSLHPSHIHLLALPSLHLLHIFVLGLIFVHPPHGHFSSYHPFHPLTWVLIQPYLTCSRSYPPTVCLLALLQRLTHPMFRLSRLLGYLQGQKVGRNAYQRHLLVGQGGTNMDTILAPRHLTKDMQDLLLVIRDNIRFKKGNSNHTLFRCTKCSGG